MSKMASYIKEIQFNDCKLDEKTFKNLYDCYWKLE